MDKFCIVVNGLKKKNPVSCCPIFPSLGQEIHKGIFVTHTHIFSYLDLHVCFTLASVIGQVILLNLTEITYCY